MTPIDRGVEIFYEIKRLKILYNVKDIKIEIDHNNGEMSVHEANYTFTCR
jgi:hypothetical protein